MDKTKARSIIESTLSSGNKLPELFDLPKIMAIKAKLESCDSINAVIGILEDNRSLISKAFGLSDSVFYEGVVRLKVLQ